MALDEWTAHSAVVSLRLSKSYWIICPKATAMLPKITLCRDWLRAEAVVDERRLKALGRRSGKDLLSA
jgi:hypothetical protein